MIKLNPIYSKESIKKSFNIVILEPHHLKNYAHEMIARIQSLLIHIYLGNVNEEEFLEIKEQITEITNKVQEQTQTNLADCVSEDVLSEEENEALNLELTILDNLIDEILPPYEEIALNTKKYFDPLLLVSKEIDEKSQVWNNLQPLLERVALIILPKHKNSDSKRAESLYLSTTELLMNFLDSLANSKKNLDISIPSSMPVLRQLGFREFASEGFLEYVKLKEVYNQAEGYKQVFASDFPKLAESYPYACFDEEDYQNALKSFNKSVNNTSFKALSLNALEIAVGILAAYNLPIDLSNPENYLTIGAIGVLMVVLNWTYYNKLDRKLESEEVLHNEIEEQLELYLSRKRQKQIN